MDEETTLTSAELLIAAECAARYPRGFGGAWGHGPLVNKDTSSLADHPEWLPYG